MFLCSNVLEQTENFKFQFTSFCVSFTDAQEFPKAMLF